MAAEALQAGNDGGRDRRRLTVAVEAGDEQQAAVEVLLGEQEGAPGVRHAELAQVRRLPRQGAQRDIEAPVGAHADLGTESRAFVFDPEAAASVVDRVIDLAQDIEQVADAGDVVRVVEATRDHVADVGHGMPEILVVHLHDLGTARLVGTTGQLDDDVANVPHLLVLQEGELLEVGMPIGHEGSPWVLRP